MLSTRTRVLLFVAVASVGLSLACFFVRAFLFWVLVGLAMLNLVIWFRLAVAQLVYGIRFGARVTFDEIVSEKDPIRMVRLLRYHLGWSPGKIAAELNRSGVTNHGVPWREHDVGRAVKGIGRVL